MADTAVEHNKSMEGHEAGEEKPVWQQSGRPKDGPMWAKDVVDIPPPGRQLLEKYSGIPPDEVVPHALELVRSLPFDWTPICCRRSRYAFTRLNTSKPHPTIAKHLLTHDNSARKAGRLLPTAA